MGNNKGKQKQKKQPVKPVVVNKGPKNPGAKKKK